MPITLLQELRQFEQEVSEFLDLLSDQDSVVRKRALDGICQLLGEKVYHVCLSVHTRALTDTLEHRQIDRHTERQTRHLYFHWREKERV
jgi:HEAT repeat protein